MRHDLRQLRKLLGLALLGAVAACGSEITDVQTVEGPQFSTTPGYGVALLKKKGPAGTTATFSISATGGTLTQGSVVTVDACPEEPCPFIEVWTGDTSEEVTITETGFTGDLFLEAILLYSDPDGTIQIPNPDPPSVTFTAGPGDDTWVTFKNQVPRPPKEEEGIAGCTPGFWKQTQHFAFWTAPYAPWTPFGDVFTDAFPDMSLLQVLDQGGGGLDALGRHTVAALLNAASPNVDYGATPAQVISAFNAAVASGDYETQKDIFEGWNERGCTADTEF